jgi:hypothetical protein
MIMVVLTAVFMCMQVIVDIVVIVKQEMVRNANDPSFVVIHKHTMFLLVLTVELDVVSVPRRTGFTTSRLRKSALAALIGHGLLTFVCQPCSGQPEVAYMLSLST